jgi:mannose-6-phosphate isomerase-like protein (cupin superfamily)
MADRSPHPEHGGTCTVWWMYDAREAFDETTGGNLEFVIEFEVAGGAVFPGTALAAREYYYVLAGYGLMTIGDETREIGPGDLVSIPPGAVHSLAPVSGHAPIRCLAYAVGTSAVSVFDAGAAPAALRGQLYRSIRDVAPEQVREGVSVWSLVAPGELSAETAGGHLELTNEWVVDGGGAVNTHAHPPYEFYYGLAGRGVMTLDGESRGMGPGDLILIGPDVPHSIRPIGENAPVRCFNFAIGLAGSSAYDYAQDRAVG